MEATLTKNNFKIEAMTKEELRKEFEEETGFSESDQHRFYDNDGHEVDFEYFWDEYEEWKTTQLLKARQELEAAKEMIARRDTQLEEERKDASNTEQELERVRAFAYTVIFTSDQSKQWQAERRKQLEGLTNNQQRDDNPRI